MITTYDPSHQSHRTMNEMMMETAAEEKKQTKEKKFILF
jgi:hypothetical protein